MKKSLLALLITLNLSLGLFAQPCKEIIGYYPNWQWYDRAKLVAPASIAYAKYSIINYCFFKPEASGLISNTDSWADENLLQGQINWSTTPPSYYPNTSLIDKAHAAGVKVMVSIGGWTLSDNFPTIAASSAKRALFAKECNRLLNFYKFDGIDIDWEYPGYAAHSGTPADKQNFTLLLQQIRDSITVLGTKNGKNYLLSACFAADPVKANDIEWNNVKTILDMINLMSYDFFGAFDCLANHNAPLYAPVSGNPAFNVHSAFTMLTNTYNVPASKINIGTAFYGRSQTGATALHQATSCNEDNVTFQTDAGSPTYFNILAKMNLFNYYWDNTAQVPYLIGKPSGSAAGTFVSYDDKKSIGLKAQYIKNNNARGTIIWEITGDYIETAPGSGVVAGTPLLDTLNQVFCNSTPLSLDDKPKKGGLFTIFPSPFIRFFQISNLGASGTLHVLDGSGYLLKVVSLQKGENIIDMEEYPSGFYIARIQIGEELVNVKIVKE